MSARRGRKNDPAYVRNSLCPFYLHCTSVPECVCVCECHLESLRKNAIDTFRCEIVLADFFCSTLFGLIRRRIFTAIAIFARQPRTRRASRAQRAVIKTF